MRRVELPLKRGKESGIKRDGKALESHASTVESGEEKH